MKTVHISLNSIDKVKAFVNEITKFDNDFDLVSGRYVIMKKAALHNLGCKVNSYETEVMQEMLEKQGYEIVSFDEKADVYLINTCSVTNMADRKSRQIRQFFYILPCNCFFDHLPELCS